jgi:hypothetical protein
LVGRLSPRRAGMLRQAGWLLNAHAVRRPIAAAALAATTKNVAGDLIIQKGLEKREHIDWRRTGMFAAFGVAFVGIVQYKVLVDFAPRFFGLVSATKTSARNLAAAKIVAFDQLGFFPFVYLPAFFVMREGALGAYAEPSVLVQKGLETWRVNLWDDMCMQW